MFTPARISVLELLASQAAISLENARLYNDLQEREATIRRLVDSNIVGIVIWDIEGRIMDANQAFLDMVGYAREDFVSGRLRWTELSIPGSIRQAPRLRRRPASKNGALGMSQLSVLDAPRVGATAGTGRNVLSAWARSIRTWFIHRQGWQELNLLDDHLLRDVGFSREVCL